MTTDERRFRDMDRSAVPDTAPAAALSARAVALVQEYAGRLAPAFVLHTQRVAGAPPDSVLRAGDCIEAAQVLAAEVLRREASGEMAEGFAHAQAVGAAEAVKRAAAKARASSQNGTSKLVTIK